MKYYWGVLVVSTGEIAEQGRGYSSAARALQGAAAYLKSRSYDDADEVYAISVYDKPPIEGGRSFSYFSDVLEDRRVAIKSVRVRRDQID